MHMNRIRFGTIQHYFIKVHLSQLCAWSLFFDNRRAAVSLATAHNSFSFYKSRDIDDDDNSRNNFRSGFLFCASSRPRLSRTILFLLSFSSSRAMPFVPLSRFEAELKGKKIKDWTDKRTMTFPPLSLWRRLLFAFSARRRSTADNEAIHLFFSGSSASWHHLVTYIAWRHNRFDPRRK